MAFTAYRTWVAGEVVTAAIGNEQWRDNGRYMHGDDGVPTIKSGLTIDNSDGDEYLKLPLLTTGEAAAALDAEGKVAFDETLHRLAVRDNVAVRNVVLTSDVDDTPVNGADTDPISSNWAYDFQQALTTAGDITYATGAGVWDRLAIGTIGHVLSVAAGGVAPEWRASIATKVLWIPAVSVAVNAVVAGYGDYPAVHIDNAAELAHGSGAIPHDFNTVTSAVIVIATSGSATTDFDWQIDTDFAAGGEAVNTHSDSTTGTNISTTTQQWIELDISAALTGIAAGDYLGYKFQSTDLGASVTAVDVLGVKIRYS